MSNTDRDSLLERWADGMEKLAQYYEDKYGPPATPATLPNVTTRDGMLEAIADQMEQAVVNINKVSPAYHNTSVDYAKTVPPISVSADIEILGGKSVSQNGELLSAEVTDIVSKDNGGNVIQTYSVPAEVQALTGYGWGTDGAYNYIDYKRKVFVQAVGKIVIDGDTIALTAGGTVGSNHRFNTATGIVDATFADANDNNGNCIAAPVEYNTVKAISGAGTTTTDAVAIHNTNGSIYMSFTDPAITSKALANEWLQSNPVTIYYRLNTPIETDISAYLTDATLDVEGGGTVVFENDNEIPVPNTVMFWVA